MMRRMQMVLTAALLLVGAAYVSAHEEFRVIGTLTRISDAAVDVKNKEGKTISIRMDKQTVISRDKKKVPVGQLKTGQSLVVDAYGDSEKDLLALEIRIVPPIRGTK
jgi:hypothetical protein